jgi:mercuric ion transport protein
LKKDEDPGGDEEHAAGLGKSMPAKRVHRRMRDSCQSGGFQMMNTTVKQAVAALPGIGVSLLPKLMCPVCWPAYAGILSALGLGFLISAKYLLSLTVLFLAMTSFALGFRASRRQGYGPLWVGLLAAALILTGNFYFDAEQATYAGVGLLVAASVWNSWPRADGENSGLARNARGESVRRGNQRGQSINQGPHTRANVCG